MLNMGGKEGPPPQPLKEGATGMKDAWGPAPGWASSDLLLGCPEPAERSQPRHDVLNTPGAKQDQSVANQRSRGARVALKSPNPCSNFAAYKGDVIPHLPRIRAVGNKFISVYKELRNSD